MRLAVGGTVSRVRVLVAVDGRPLLSMRPLEVALFVFGLSYLPIVLFVREHPVAPWWISSESLTISRAWDASVMNFANRGAA